MSYAIALNFDQSKILLVGRVKLLTLSHSAFIVNKPNQIQMMRLSLEKRKKLWEKEIMLVATGVEINFFCYLQKIASALISNLLNAGC